MPGAGKWKAAMMAQTLDAIVVEVEARHISGICGQLGLHGKFQDGPNTESYLFKKQNKMEKKNQQMELHERNKLLLIEGDGVQKQPTERWRGEGGWTQ